MAGDNTILLNILYEDIIHFAAIEKVLSFYFTKKYRLGNSYTKNGRSYISTKILGFNKTAGKYSPLLTLVDLDRDKCAPSLINSWFNNVTKSRYHLFRVAVREVETWLLADGVNLAEFLHIHIDQVNKIGNLEGLTSPKETLVQLAMKSRKKNIREGIGSTRLKRIQGPEYNIYIPEFVKNYWNPSRARKKSDSLDRFIHALDCYC